MLYDEAEAVIASELASVFVAHAIAQDLAAWRRWEALAAGVTTVTLQAVLAKAQHWAGPMQVLPLLALDAAAAEHAGAELFVTGDRAVT